LGGTQNTVNWRSNCHPNDADPPANPGLSPLTMLRPPAGSLLLTVALPSAGPQLDVRDWLQPSPWKIPVRGVEEIPPPAAADGVEASEICLTALQAGGGRRVDRRAAQRRREAREPGTDGPRLELDEEVSVRVQGRPDLGIRHRLASGAAVPDVDRPRAEDVRGHDVEHLRLVDRFHRELGEQGVGPVKQVADAIHHDGLLERTDPVACNRPRIERVALVCRDRLRIGQNRAECRRRQATEVVELPNAVERIRSRHVGGCRIEDVAVPPPCRLELPLRIEGVGDRERDLKEDLPVVGAISSVEIEPAHVGEMGIDPRQIRDGQRGFGDACLRGRREKNIEAVLEHDLREIALHGCAGFCGQRGADSPQEVAAVVVDGPLQEQQVPADLQQSVFLGSGDRKELGTRGDRRDLWRGVDLTP